MFGSFILIRVELVEDSQLTFSAMNDIHQVVILLRLNARNKTVISRY